MTSLILDIHKPCTSEEISAAKIAAKKKYNAFITIVSLMGLGVVGGLGSSFLFSVEGVDLGERIAFVLMMLVTAICVFSESDNFDEVPERECGRLLAACMSTAEGQNYREAVLAQGRKFLEVEALMIYAWTAQQDTGVDCKKLYGILGD